MSSSITPEDAKHCIRSLSTFIKNDLIKHYNYGKQWTVYMSMDSCFGKKNANVAEVQIGPIIVLVQFSNPTISPVLIPFEKINENLVSRKLSLLEMLCFWDHLCPYPWVGIEELAEKFYRKLELNNYCGSRSLCAVCTGRILSSSMSNVTKESVFAPCILRSPIPVLMGPEMGQEMQYPPDDRFCEEDLFSWLNILIEEVHELNIKYKKEIKRTERAIQDEFEFEELAEEIVTALEE